jgi:hypothetical protein
MPTKPENRDYKKEAARESAERQQDRRDRMNARYAFEKKNGDLPTNVQVDHVKSLGRGGTNAPSNLRAIPKKRNESFDRVGPGGKQRGRA